jgi:hypothetical protein
MSYDRATRSARPPTTVINRAEPLAPKGSALLINGIRAGRSEIGEVTGGRMLPECRAIHAEPGMQR